MTLLSETSDPWEKPQAVVRAVQLLCVTIVIGFVRTLEELPTLRAQLSLPTILLVLSVSFGFLIGLVYLINLGRNWARFLMTLLFVVGLPFAIVRIWESLKATPVSGLLDLLQFVLQAVAFGLLYTRSASAWFRP